MSLEKAFHHEDHLVNIGGVAMVRTAYPTKFHRLRDFAIAPDANSVSQRDVYNGERSAWEPRRGRSSVLEPQSGSECTLTQSVTAIKLSRHVGMDCRHPDYMEVINACHPWHWIPPVLGGMTRVFVILMTVTQSVGTLNIKRYRFHTSETSQAALFVSRKPYSEHTA